MLRGMRGVVYINIENIAVGNIAVEKVTVENIAVEKSDRWKYRR